MKKLIRSLLARFDAEITVHRRNPQQRRVEKELRRLESAPEFSILTSSVFGRPLHFASSRAFAHLYREVVERQTYRFEASGSPYIIDCGANVGIGTLYFKQLYPNAEVLCFEPDPIAFELLQKNIQSLGLSGVTSLQKAVWTENAQLKFDPDPSSTAGRINFESKGDMLVSAVPLRDFLTRPVDLLKIDIEGAETEVLESCKDRLFHVRNLFVEYHSYVGMPQTLHRLVAVLAEAGFRVYVENGGRHSPQPFIEWWTHKKMDLSLNIFAKREDQATQKKGVSAPTKLTVPTFSAQK